jgi:GntR family transcriptional regulator
MLIRIDTTIGTPIWSQIVSQVTRQVMSGTLDPGDRLPTVRELAADLRINPNTAARAYQDLERDGLVETRRGAGTFVCDIAKNKTPDDLRKAIENRFDEIVVEAMHVNLAPEDLIRLFKDRLDAMVLLHGSATPARKLILAQEGTE